MQQQVNTQLSLRSANQQPSIKEEPVIGGRSSMKSKMKVRVVRHSFDEKRTVSGTIVETNY